MTSETEERSSIFYASLQRRFARRRPVEHGASILAVAAAASLATVAATVVVVVWSEREFRPREREREREGAEKFSRPDFFVQAAFSALLLLNRHTNRGRDIVKKTPNTCWILQSFSYTISTLHMTSGSTSWASQPQSWRRIMRYRGSAGSGYRSTKSNTVSNFEPLNAALYRHACGGRKRPECDLSLGMVQTIENKVRRLRQIRRHRSSILSPTTRNSQVLHGDSGSSPRDLRGQKHIMPMLMRPRRHREASVKSSSDKLVFWVGKNLISEIN